MQFSTENLLLNLLEVLSKSVSFVLYIQVLVGLHDVSDEMVHATLHALADLVGILGGETVIGTSRSCIFADSAPRVRGQGSLTSVRGMCFYVLQCYHGEGKNNSTSSWVTKLTPSTPHHLPNCSTPLPTTHILHQSPAPLARRGSKTAASRENEGKERNAEEEENGYQLCKTWSVEKNC